MKRSFLGLAVSAAVVAGALISIAPPAAYASSEFAPVARFSAGSAPSSVTFDQKHRLLWVASGAESSVVSIDVDDQRQSGATISVDSGPLAAAIDDDANRLYVISPSRHSLTVIDTETGTVVGTPISVGGQPSAVAVAESTGMVYVTDYTGSAVYAVDPVARSVSAPIRVGVGPRGVAIDQVGHLAIVTNFADDSVSVIDLAAGAVVGTPIPVGNNPWSVVVDSARRLAYVANSKDRTVTVIDDGARTATGTPIPIDGPIRGMSLDETGNRVFVASSSLNSLWVIDGKHAAATASPLTGEGAVDVAFDPQTGLLYLANLGFDAIDVARDIAGVVRRSGADRYDVSAATSAAAFNPGVSVAYVASGQVFTDALSGSAAAGSRGGPVLLVTKDAVPAAVAAELTRLKPQRIELLGGTATISDTVRAGLSAFSPIVERISGADRYEVSAAVSRGAFGTSMPIAYVASGENFPDALSGSAAAGMGNAPVLLVQKNALPSVVTAELARLAPSEIVVLGGPDTVSDTVLTELGHVAKTTRVGGADRFAVSAAISARTFPTPVTTVYVASGSVFSDALSGSAAAIHTKAPVLLVTRDTIPAAVRSELTRLGPTRIVVLGGENTVGAAVYTELSSFLK